ncbi:MAG: sugar ABC transporter permease [Firmicutes bacterium]|nr:sugar ABC transporter permease [Bacillota bacterium]
MKTKKRKAYQESVLGRNPKSQLALQLMALPAIVSVILFSYLPMYGVIIAFKNYNIFKGIMASPWARNNGFEHFIDFFKTPAALSVVLNTLKMAGLMLVFTTWPPMLLAILLNELRSSKFMKTVQTCSYLPHFISWAVCGGIFYSLLNPTSGAINLILTSIGVMDKSINFLSDPRFLVPIMVLLRIWKGIGWGSIIYLGVIVSIDQQLYEAVEIDGGQRFAKIRYVTIPHLVPTFVLLFILECGKIMSGGDTFNQVYVFSNVTNRGLIDILDTYILRTGFENGRYSYSTAVNLFKSVINVILLLTANWVSKKATETSLF